MTRTEFDFQPGSVLHAAIIGAFRANGSTFDGWCKENGILPTVARQATFGQSRGPNGQNILARMIEAAGVDFVRHVYERRLLDHAEQIRTARRKRGAA
ncbi:hypothetical protein [Paracoccus sp. (in: a-proteobacteria)]|uniref:hypothetical protein n=1 Tax=Paracoccus sp. TaxID=267 RepID=UPI0028AC4DD6|nr:hypothetical protein [Paracoccus sp. (in: a-proteobacteria)]